jgi:hypothetical protein
LPNDPATRAAESIKEWGRKIRPHTLLSHLVEP